MISYYMLDIVFDVPYYIEYTLLAWDIESYPRTLFYHVIYIEWYKYAI